MLILETNKKDELAEFSDPRPFEESSLLSVFDVPGVYLIYDSNGPVYGGRSKALRRRLLEHLRGRGNKNVAHLMMAGKPLRFSILTLYSNETREVEAALIASLGLTRFANMIHAGLYENEVGLDRKFARRVMAAPQW
jgi:hypothetical protein